MLGVAAKVAAIAGALGVLAFHQLTAAAAAPIGLTNVTGAAGDCSAPVRDGACASLFHGGPPLWPGGPAEVASVTLGYHGGASSRFGVYLAHFVSRDRRSSATCQADDPAARLTLTILDSSGRSLYSGHLSDFAAAHHDAPSLFRLPALRDGQEVTYTLTVALDAAADNAYMGCSTATDIAWLAE